MYAFSQKPCRDTISAHLADVEAEVLDTIYSGEDFIHHLLSILSLQMKSLASGSNNNYFMVAIITMLSSLRFIKCFYIQQICIGGQDLGTW